MTHFAPYEIYQNNEFPPLVDDQRSYARPSSSVPRLKQTGQSPTASCLITQTLDCIMLTPTTSKYFKRASCSDVVLFEADDSSLNQHYLPSTLRFSSPSGITVSNAGERQTNDQAPIDRCTTIRRNAGCASKWNTH